MKDKCFFFLVVHIISMLDFHVQNVFRLCPCLASNCEMLTSNHLYSKIWIGLNKKLWNY